MKHSILALATLIGLTGAVAAQDLVAEGETVFRKCQACHTVGPDARNRVGPQLNNVFGRTAGNAEGFKYSDVIVALGENGMVWNTETFSGYVADPRGWLVDIAPEYGLDCAQLRRCRGRMVFAGIKDPDDLAALIAYLETFSEQPANGSDS